MKSSYDDQIPEMRIEPLDPLLSIELWLVCLLPIPHTGCDLSDASTLVEVIALALDRFIRVAARILFDLMIQDVRTVRICVSKRRNR